MFLILLFFFCRQNVLLQGQRLLGIRRPEYEGGPQDAEAVGAILDGMPTGNGVERRGSATKIEGSLERRDDTEVNDLGRHYGSGARAPGNYPKDNVDTERKILTIKM